MIKYINAEKLKAEIEKGYNSAKESEEYDDDMYETGRADAYEDVIHIIDSLPKEKEIDLDEEITKYWKDISSIYGAVGKEITRFDFDDACKYFYELGKNGR